MAAYQLHRGLQTLPLRVRAAQSGAERISHWLLSHPAVSLGGVDSLIQHPA